MQFETIHPFLDGNGRVGRLLITLLCCHAGVLREPLLYLSLYLKQHRAAYYDLLDRVRRDGDWEAWLAFFLEGVRETAEGAVDTAQELAALFREDRARIEPQGRRAGSALRVHEAIKARPISPCPRSVAHGALVPGRLLGHGPARRAGDRARADRQAPEPAVRVTTATSRS